MCPVKSPGEAIRLQCAIPTTILNPIVGEKGDSFVLSFRLSSAGSWDVEKNLTQHESIRRTGYSAMFQMFQEISMSECTKPCSHAIRADTTVTLDPRWVAVGGFCLENDRIMGPTLIVCLTADSRASRWRALIGIHQNGLSEVHDWSVLLRTDNCCLRCAMHQVSVLSGPHFLIL